MAPITTHHHITVTNTVIITTTLLLPLLRYYYWFIGRWRYVIMATYESLLWHCHYATIIIIIINILRYVVIDIGTAANGYVTLPLLLLRCYYEHYWLLLPLISIIIIALIVIAAWFCLLLSLLLPYCHITMRHREYHYITITYYYTLLLVTTLLVAITTYIIVYYYGWHWSLLANISLRHYHCHIVGYYVITPLLYCWLLVHCLLLYNWLERAWLLLLSIIAVTPLPLRHYYAAIVDEPLSLLLRYGYYCYYSNIARAGW